MSFIIAFHHLQLVLGGLFLGIDVGVVNANLTQIYVSEKLENARGSVVAAPLHNPSQVRRGPHGPRRIHPIRSH